MIETVSTLVSDNFWLAGLLFIGLYIVSTVFSLPGALALTISSGAIFGWFWGGLFSAIGAWIGAMIIFVAVKYYASDYFISRLPKNTESLRLRILKHEFLGMLALRCAPVVPFFAVNILAGCLKVSNRTYMITTAVGMFWSFVYAASGAGIIEIGKLL